MIVILPYAPGAADYQQLAADIRKRGPVAPHPLRVISHADHSDAAYDLGQEIADLFGPATYHGVALPEDRTRPVQVANDLFFASMAWLNSLRSEKGEPDTPLALYLDPTYRPTKPGWLKDLQSAYFFAGAPAVFGRILTAPDGEKTFVGPVVISKAFPKSSALLNFLPDNTHWRAYLRSEMLVSHAETNLIGTSAEAVLKAPVKPKKT